MDKKELRKHPIISVEEGWVNLIEQAKHSNIKFFVAVDKFSKDIIILNIIDKSQIDKISYRVFISKDDYITQDFTSDSIKWKTGALEFILDQYSWYEKSISVDVKSTDILSKFLGVDNDCIFNALDNLQRKIKAKKLSNKHRVTKNRIDERMKYVPSIPKNFDKWINDKVLFDSRYIYYIYKPSETMEGYCTHCGCDVNVKGAKHNIKGKCPNCKSQITFKSVGKSKNIVDYGKGTLIQKVKDQLLIRHFNIVKHYGVNFRNPRLEYKELQRYFVDKDGESQAYEFGNFTQTGEYRWCEGIRNNSPYTMFYSKSYDFLDTTLYTLNLSKVLKDSFLKYSGLKEFAQYKNVKGFPVISYICNYLDFPGLEYLVKLKLYKIVEDVLYGYRSGLNKKGNNVFEVLGIDKIQLRTLQRINGGFGILSIIKEAEKVKLKLSDEQIVLIDNHTRIERVIKAAKYTTIHKILEYVASQSSENREFDYTLSDWLDYIEFCKELNKDLKNDFILFPRNLTKSHDELSSLIKDKKRELYNSKVEEMHETLNTVFSWQYRDIAVVVPKSYDDIVKEGDSLNHCVGKGSYGKRIIEGKSIILFLREKYEIDRPFYTIELDTNSYEILQCRGKLNKVPENQIKKKLDVYKREILSQLQHDIAV